MSNTTPKAIDTLSPAEKRALLAELLRKKAQQPKELPVSYAQQRLWFLNRLEPGSPLYNVPAALRMMMPLHVKALEAALNEIVRRHESLRTVFVERDGLPLQRILPQLQVRLPVIELSGFSPTVRESEAQRLATQEAQRPFDLTTGPLLRASLLRLGETDHVLLLTMHHIVSDGWSMTVFFRELSQLYEAYVRGEESPLPPLPVQYADFAQWQRNYLQGAVLESELSYWREQLAGAPAVLELPTDRARPAVQSFRGAVQVFAVSGEVAQGLKRLSQEAGATLFMTLLAAFKVLLYRYTGQGDLVVGTPIANRTRAELEGLIGFFVNTLVLRTRVEGELSFRELLERVKEVTLAAYAHQDLPFEKLVEELHPQRSLSHNPLFQVMFSLQTDQIGNVNMNENPEPAFHTDQAMPTLSKFDLSWLLTETNAGLTGTIEYNTDLFDDATIARVKGYFEQLLGGIAHNPDQAIRELPLLSAAERQLMLHDWNATGAEYEEACFHELFERQAELTPTNAAAVFNDQSVSYAELNARSNQLAGHLKKAGVGPETLVGVCIDRSIEMIVGVLGILKAGAAYVPLDPSYPHARLDFILKDTGVPVVVTQRKQLAKLPESSAQTVLLDDDWPAISEESSDNLDALVSPDNLAYVIYTSGSSGQPKGVMATHRGLANMIAAQISTFGLTSEERVLQFSSLSFDISIWDVALAFGVGATLCLADQESLLPGTPLQDLIRRQRVTVVTLLPSVLNTLDPDQLPDLKLVIAGAEACSAETAARWRKHCRFVNGYGPTETTVWATYTEAFDETRNPPIGHPIANTTTYVLDAHGQPCPVGMAGELYIGGVAVTRGYLHRPALTADRFVPDPFSASPGRLYRTGDRVRYLADGQIEFLGRIDHQVKVRGYRIELAEIDFILNQHPQVENAVTVVHQDDSGSRLIAYVVPRDAEALGKSELREHVKKELPEYMLPSSFVFVERLPLTPNGKIDRKALTMTPRVSTERERQPVAPRTPVEQKLVEIWQEVLQVDRIGVDDNFFELGGHSLVATQIISRVRDSFQIELPLRAVFETPTVEAIARVIQTSSNGHEKAPVDLQPLDRVAERDEIPASYAQQRLWFIDQLIPGNALYNLSGGFRITTPLHVKALEAALNEIVRRHESLRTVFVERDGLPLQRILPQLQLRLPVIELGGFSPAVRESEAQRLATQEGQRPFDLTTGPLLRASLLRLGETDHVLLLTMHHIVSDGWSMTVFFRELSQLYEAYVRGEESPLPPLPVQYADFAQWQRNYLQGAVLESELSYWREQLAGAPAVLELPTDRARPAVQSFRGAVQVFAVSGEVAQGLKRLSQEAGATLFMTLLAAFKVLLYRYTGQGDLVVGTPIANRTRAELEGLIGFFVNTLVLRTRVGGELSFRELLERVKEVTLAAYAHQDLPFEKLVEELHPQRSLSHNPLFQVMFVLQNATATPSAQLNLEDSLPHQVDTGSAKMDLTLYMIESGQELVAGIEYNLDLYSAELIKRLINQFERLLVAIVANPGSTISELVATLENYENEQRQKQVTGFRQRSQSQLKVAKRKAIG